VDRTTDNRIIQSVKINKWTLLPGSDARKDERGRTTSDTVTDTNRNCPIGIAAVETNSRHSLVTPEEVSRKWRIGLETAQQTLRVTTQQGIRTALHPITRRYRVDHIDLNRNRLNSPFYTDSLFSKVTSLPGNKCAQVYTNGEFTAVYPMASKQEAGDTLAAFSQDVGIPEHLTTDLAGEVSGPNTAFMKHVRRLPIDLQWSERGRKNQNHKAEREIGILKQRWRKRMSDKGVPTRLWDYGLVYDSELLSRISRGPDNRTGYERLTGQTPDISEWLDFEFYDRVWFHHITNKPDITDDPRRLGRWLGIFHRIGSDLCYWILTDSGKVVSSSTVQHVIRADLLNPTTQERITTFDARVSQVLSDDNFIAVHRRPFR
jgi:hypothetical protein